MELVKIWVYILAFSFTLIIIGTIEKKKIFVLMGVIVIIVLIIGIFFFIRNAT